MTHLISPYRVNWLCALPAVLLGLWGPPFHCLICCCIASDRVFSLLTPMRYRQFNQKYALCMIFLCAVLVTILDAVGLTISPLFKIVVCREFSDNLDRGFKQAFAGLMLAYFSLTVLLYLVMITCFHYRRKISGNENDALFRQQAAVMPAIKVMMILYLATGVLGEALINAARSIEPSPLFLPIRGFGSILKSIGCLVEIFSLMIKSSKFRLCCKAFLGCKPRAVGQTTSVGVTSRAECETRY